MDDRDILCICLCIIGLSAVSLLHGKMIMMVADKISDVDADVKFLMDHGLVRETEARP